MLPLSPRRASTSVLRAAVLFGLGAVLLLGPAVVAAQNATSLPLRNQRLRQNIQYPSSSGDHYLIFQNNGNLVVYSSGGERVWALSDVSPDWRSNTRVVMQEDGNLVAYERSRPTWATNTHGNQNAVLKLLPSGELRVVLGERVLWSNGARSGDRRDRDDRDTDSDERRDRDADDRRDRDADRNANSAEIEVCRVLLPTLATGRAPRGIAYNQQVVDVLANDAVTRGTRYRVDRMRVDSDERGTCSIRSDEFLGGAYYFIRLVRLIDGSGLQAHSAAQRIY